MIHRRHRCHSCSTHLSADRDPSFSSDLFGYVPLRHSAAGSSGQNKNSAAGIVNVASTRWGSPTRISCVGCNKGLLGPTTTHRLHHWDGGAMWLTPLRSVSIRHGRVDFKLALTDHCAMASRGRIAAYRSRQSSPGVYLSLHLNCS